MSAEETIYVVMPAYNEEDTIADVVTSWYPIVEMGGSDSRLVVADSGSSDNTHAILCRLRNDYPRLSILEDSDKQHGPKLIALYNHAIEQGADWVFQTDSDGQTNPDEFAGFWELRHQYDAILGERVERGDGKQRAFVERVVCLLLKLYFGVSVPDANAPFRLMRASVLGKYVGRFEADYNLPNIMLTTWFAHYNERIAFRPITFKPRQGGVNSINIPRIVGIGWHALGDFRKFKKGL